MREAFQEDLAALGRLLVAMAEAAGDAMRRATWSLLVVDRDAAERVVEDDGKIDKLYRESEERAYHLLARQAPVASDLRSVVTSLHVAADLERMGDLAQHVAKIALLRHPQGAVPHELTGVIEEMAGVADRMAIKVARVISTRDAAAGAELAHDDDDMDSLHRRLFTILLGDWPHGVEAAIDSALLGRFYERYADHAVNAGRHVVYLVTGA